MPVPGVAAKAFLLKFAVLQHQIANAARINTGLNLAAQNLEAVRFVINGVQELSIFHCPSLEQSSL